MKLITYSTKNADRERVQKAIIRAAEYLKPLSVSFLPLVIDKTEEKDKSIYETANALSSKEIKKVKSVKDSVLESLPLKGSDGAILFLSKKRSLAASTLKGQHSLKGDKSYIEIYEDKDYARIIKGPKIYSIDYVPNKTGSFRDGTTQVLIHECLHALSDFHGIPDRLHDFISEGAFDSYMQYLLDGIKKDTGTNAGYLYEMALKCIGTDVTPKDEVPDVVACAAGVNAVYKKAFGKEIGGGASTHNLYQSLLAHSDFTKVLVPAPGDVVISPTGYGNGKLSNGHTGFVLQNGLIASNSSADGIFKQNYTLATWRNRYGVLGGFPVAFFRRK